MVNVTANPRYATELFDPLDLVFVVETDTRLEDFIFAGRGRKRAAVGGVDLVDALPVLCLKETIVDAVVPELEAECVLNIAIGPFIEQRVTGIQSCSPTL